jgi:hypothetical protein
VTSAQASDAQASDAQASDARATARSPAPRAWATALALAAGLAGNQSLQVVRRGNPVSMDYQIQ